MKRLKNQLDNLLVIAGGLILTSCAHGQGFVSQWSNMITNPAPEVGNSFGVTLAAQGGGRVLVGALGVDPQKRLVPRHSTVLTVSS